MRVCGSTGARSTIDPVAAHPRGRIAASSGRIAEVVYLGMFTQFQVETAAGPILCHRLADEDARGLHRRHPGRAHVADRSDGRLAAPPGPPQGCDDLAEPPFGEPASSSAPTHEDQRRGHHHHGDGDHLGQPARETQRAVEVDRERRLGARNERRDRVLVERDGQRDQEAPRPRQAGSAAG